MTTTHAYIVTLDHEPLAVCTSWRNAYRFMLNYIHDQGKAYPTPYYIHQYHNKDVYTWMNTKTGEVVDIAIQDMRVDENVRVP